MVTIEMSGAETLLSALQAIGAHCADGLLPIEGESTEELGARLWAQADAWDSSEEREYFRTHPEDFQAQYFPATRPEWDGRELKYSSRSGTITLTLGVGGAFWVTVKAQDGLDTIDLISAISDMETAEITKHAASGARQYKPSYRLQAVIRLALAIGYGAEEKEMLYLLSALQEGV